MSYSVANVLIEAGAERIGRWLPYELSLSEVSDRLRNKMIRPTTIPQTLEDLYLEQAVCREALRLSLEHHISLAVGLSGTQRQRTIADIFSQSGARYELVDLMKLDLVIGSGGVLSHAPNRLAAALMMIDGFGLRGVTQITVDSIFMLPHLGVFASVHPEAATEILYHDCLVHLGHVIAPVFAPSEKGAELATVRWNGSVVGTVRQGVVERIAISQGERGTLIVEPLTARIELGAGPGVPVTRELEIGQFGFILDGRNRPISFAAASAERIAQQQQVYRALGLEM